MKSSPRLLTLPVLAFPFLFGLAHAQEAPRTFLSKAEIEKTVIGKSMTHKEVATGTVRKWDLRSDGRIYYNNISNTNKVASGSGTWDLKDDGALCVHWSRVADGSGSCSYFSNDGDTLVRTDTNTAAARIITRIEKFE